MYVLHIRWHHPGHAPGGYIRDVYPAAIVTMYIHRLYTGCFVIYIYLVIISRILPVLLFLMTISGMNTQWFKSVMYV